MNAKHQTKTFSGLYVNTDLEVPSQLRVGRRIRPDSKTVSGWALIIVIAILTVSILVLMAFPEMPGL